MQPSAIQGELRAADSHAVSEVVQSCASWCAIDVASDSVELPEEEAVVAEEMVNVAEPDEAMMAGEKALDRAAVAAGDDALLLDRSSSPSRLSTPPPPLDASVLVAAVVDRTAALAPVGGVGATEAEFVDDPAPPSPKTSSKPPPELDVVVCATV